MAGNQKKYICSYCAKAFSRSEHKARHERSHMGVKPFECKVCRHAFVRRDLLQRHIRTVHRDLLLLRRKAQQEEEQRVSDGGGEAAGDEHGQDDLYLELLVNSMIRVDSERLVVSPLLRQEKRRLGAQSGQLEDEQCRAVHELFGSFLGTSGISKEQVAEFYKSGLSRLSMDETWGHVVKESNNDPDVVFAITCLGCLEAGFNDAVWQVGWSNAESILALSILAYTLVVRERAPADIEQFLDKFQRVYLEARVLQEYHWLTFDVWVQLLRITRVTNDISILILDKILDFKINGLETLRSLLRKLHAHKRLPLPILNYLANIMFCNWLFYDKYSKSKILSGKQQTHLTLLLLNDHYYEMTQPQKQQQQSLLQLSDVYKNAIQKLSIPIQSDCHWLLLETIWFEFMDQINKSNQVWFMDTIAPMDISLINENLSICSLPVLKLVQEHNQLQYIKSRYISLVTDVLVFLLKIFEHELSANYVKSCPDRIFALLSNPSIQLLLLSEYWTFVKKREIEMYAIDNFVNDFLLNENKNETTSQIQASFLDNQSLHFIGYYQLVQAIIFHLKHDIIIGKLLNLPDLNPNVKQRLYEISGDTSQSSAEPNREWIAQSPRRVTDPWPINHKLALSPGSVRSDSLGSPTASIDSCIPQAVGMSNSTSFDSSTNFRNSNIILPPLNMHSMRRLSLDQSLMSRNQYDMPPQLPPNHQAPQQSSMPYQAQQRDQQYSTFLKGTNENAAASSYFYSYGPEPVSPKTIPQNAGVISSFATPYVKHTAASPTSVPANVNPSSSVAGGTLAKSGSFNSNTSDSTFSDHGSPQSINVVRLPPPSELFGVSSK